MHALHRPRLPHAIVVAMLAAALAIILTLASAGRVSDLRLSAPATGSSRPIAGHPPAAAAAAHAGSLAANPFRRPAIASVAAPWAAVTRSAASSRP